MDFYPCYPDILTFQRSPEPLQSRVFVPEPEFIDRDKVRSRRQIPRLSQIVKISFAKALPISIFIWFAKCTLLPLRSAGTSPRSEGWPPAYATILQPGTLIHSSLS